MVSYLLLRWRRIVRISSAISLTGAPANCRTRFVRGANTPWRRRLAEGIDGRWGRLLQPLPSPCCRSSFLHFIFTSSKSHRVNRSCQPSISSVLYLNCTWNLLVSGLTWLYFGLPKLPFKLELHVFQVPTSSMERGSMFKEWARFTQESTLDYAPPAANPSHY